MTHTCTGMQERPKSVPAARCFFVKKKRGTAMPYQEIINKTITIALTAAVSSGVTYLVCSDFHDRSEEELHARIAELEKKEQEAMVTKRVSEQMEDIAYQQKAVSDEQRERAERQSQIADMERGKAEIERGLARRAEAHAVTSARQADSMRVQAERQTVIANRERQIAEAARGKADTLYYNSLARLLAQNAIAQNNMGATDLASLLSYAAWHYTRTYGGDSYQQDVFTSLLRTADNSMQRAGQLKSSIRGITRVGDTYLAVSDYGEIATMTPARLSDGTAEKYSTETAFYEPRMVFQDVQTDGKIVCYALDINGTVVCKDFKALSVGPQYITLPSGTWKHLLRRSDGTLVAVAHNAVAWIDPSGGKVTRTWLTDGEIAEAGLVDDYLLLFCPDGIVKVMGKDSDARAKTMELPQHVTVTAFEYVPERQWLLLGTETGPIYIYNRDGRLVTTLHGHTGRITRLARLSWQLASTSYDHTLRLWDLRDTSSIITPVDITYDHWPLCFAADATQSTLCVGMEGGDIRTISVSAEKNAQSTHRSITRELTSDEWMYYIGKDVPYTHFKEERP